MSRLQNAVQQLKSKNQPILDNTDRALKLLPFEETLFEAFILFFQNQKKKSVKHYQIFHMKMYKIFLIFLHFLKVKIKLQLI